MSAGTGETMLNIHHVTTCLLISSTCLNPFLYALYGKNIRSSVQSSLRSLFCIRLIRDSKFWDTCEGICRKTYNEPHQEKFKSNFTLAILAILNHLNLNMRSSDLKFWTLREFDLLNKKNLIFKIFDFYRSSANLGRSKPMWDILPIRNLYP